MDAVGHHFRRSRNGCNPVRWVGYTDTVFVDLGALQAVLGRVPVLVQGVFVFPHVMEVV